MSGPIAFELECVVLGPAVRRQGSNYGLRTRSVGLSELGEELLEDFALSLSEWAKRAAAPFQTLFWLGDRDRLFVLLKGAFLGPGANGPIAVAQGLLIPESVMERIGGRAHRLLPLIPEPALAEWTARSLRVDWDVRTLTARSGAATDAPPPPEIAALGLSLASAKAPWPTIVLAGPESADRSRGQVLDAVPWHRLAVRPTWTSTLDLPPMGRFAPSDIGLALPATEPGAGRQGNGTLVEGDRVATRLAPPLPAFRLLIALFDGPDGAGSPGDVAERASLAAHEALQIPKWKQSYIGLSPEQVIIHAIQDVLRQGLSSGDFWDVFAMLAGNASRIDDEEMRSSASRAIDSLFSSTASRDPATFARMLGRYIDRIWPVLRSDPGRPLAWAIERGVLLRLQPAHIQRLIVACGADRLPQQLAHGLESQPHSADRQEGRMSVETAAVLLEELNKLYAGRPLTTEVVAALWAASGMGAAQAESAASGEPRERLIRALAAQAEQLMERKTRQVPGWARLALKFLPRLARLPAGVRPQAALRRGLSETQRWLQGSGAAISRRSDDDTSPDVVAVLLVLSSFFRPAPIGPGQ